MISKTNTAEKASTTHERILSRVRGGGRGKVYTNKDFLDLANRSAVDRVLSLLANSRVLSRVHRGIYYYPRTNPSLGITLSPTPDDVAAAIARRTGSRIEPSGAVAANMLGLTTQVPAKHVYHTDGPAKNIQLGNQILELKHVASKELSAKATISRFVILALRHLGRDAMGDTIIGALRSKLPASAKKQLLKDVRYQTDWIVDAARRIADSDV